MFTVFEIGPWVIEADAEETRKQYEKSWPDPCDCGHCRNFSEAVSLLPAEKTRLFTQFGIRPAVCHDLGEHGKENGLHHYAGSYPIVAGLGKAGRSFISRGREISAFRFHWRVQHFLYRRVFLTLLSISTFHSCSRGCLRKTRIKARRAMHRAQSFLPSHLSHHFLRGASLRAGTCSFSFLDGSGP